jgi:hypothetical protein
MRPRVTPLIAALLGLFTLPGAAVAQTAPEFKFSAFGTLGAVNSDERKADFIANRFQPNGPGRTRATDFGPDSKLGGQLSAGFGEQLSAVLQVVSQHQPDNSYTPRVEWANVKYQFNTEFSARVGRIASPNYLLSESRFVGYAAPWVRPPVEVYSVLPITSNDGVDLSYRNRIGELNNTFQAFYGSSSDKLPSGGNIKARQAFGFNDSVDVGSLTLRAGYSRFDIDVRYAPLDPIFNGLNSLIGGATALNRPATASQAQALKQQYALDGMTVSGLSLGANYDPGDWFLIGEAVAFKGDGLLADSRSWYGTGGWRLGSFTPYVTLARSWSKYTPETGITDSGVPALNAGAAQVLAGINAALAGFGGTQDSISAGLRWDVARNVAVKAQYDQIHVGNQGRGRLTNAPATGVPGDRVRLLSLSVDFVY